MAIGINFNVKSAKVKKTNAKSRVEVDGSNKIWFKRAYWEIDILERQDLINELPFTDEEKLILNDIVLDIEELVKDNLDRDKLGFIPYLGTFKFNSGIRNLYKHREEIKEAKKSGMDTQGLKNLRIKIYNEGIEKAEEEKAEDKLYRMYKKIYKKEYNQLYQDLGKTYAEMFIWTKTLLKPIEFDKAYQEAFERLNNL